MNILAAHSEHESTAVLVIDEEIASTINQAKDIDIDVGAMLNTSFNLHRSPLVLTIERSLFTSEESELQHLVLECMLTS
jgi:hypothetical protein